MNKINMEGSNKQKKLKKKIKKQNWHYASRIYMQNWIT